MGQKVNPHGLRVGVIKGWGSNWYADDKQFGDLLVEDNALRKYIKESLYQAGISKVDIERGIGQIVITIYTAKPGLVIGQKGAGVEALRAELAKRTQYTVRINIMEVKHPEKDAQLVAEGIAAQLENRASFRRAMKQAMGRCMKLGAKGIKVQVSGRLNGAEIARSEHAILGNLPLHTLRCDIDYGFAEANTAYGKIGVKVWVNNGEILPTKAKKEGAR